MEVSPEDFITVFEENHPGLSAPAAGKSIRGYHTVVSHLLVSRHPLILKHTLFSLKSTPHLKRVYTDQRIVFEQELDRHTFEIVSIHYVINENNFRFFVTIFFIDFFVLRSTSF